MNDSGDSDFFSAAMKGVVPLKQFDREKQVSRENRPKPKPIPRVRPADDLEALEDTYGEDLIDETLGAADGLSYAREGLQVGVLRKLRRRHYVIEDQVDLHGMSSDEARKYVYDFLNYAVAEGMRAVRIVHGKGYHSQHGPILKQKIGSWLQQRKEVLAYVSAPQADGGTGAVYVLLIR